jgi:hypothetical protein
MTILFNSPRAAISYLKRFGHIVSIVDKCIVSNDSRVRTDNDPVGKAWAYLQDQGYTVHVQIKGYSGVLNDESYQQMVDSFQQMNRQYQSIQPIVWYGGAGANGVPIDTESWDPPSYQWHSSGPSTS